MASQLWREAFQKLKLSDPRHSTASFENDSKSTNYSCYKTEMLEYERSSKNISEKSHIEKGKAFKRDPKYFSYVYKKPPITEDSYYCKSQSEKKLRVKSKISRPRTDALDIKKTEKNCEETVLEEVIKPPDPVEKKIEPEVQVSNERNENFKISPHPMEKKPCGNSSGHCYNPTKSVNKMKNYKKISTGEEWNSFNILKQSSRFRRVKASEVYKSFTSELNSQLYNIDGESKVPPGGWVTADRYTQADRMASAPIILSEIWDIEEDW